MPIARLMCVFFPALKWARVFFPQIEFRIATSESEKNRTALEILSRF